LKKLRETYRFSHPTRRQLGQPFAAALTSVPDVFTVNLPVVFDNAKDRPILFSAFASSDALLTLDRADFSDLLGAEFYGMPILKPGAFLERERIAKRLL
jgi:hypothetical protein